MLMLRYVLAFIVLLGAGSAMAKDMVVERVWLADPTGELTLADVQAMPWQPAPRKLSRGYTADTVWMRLLVEVPDPSPVVLNVRPSYLDDVRLHVPDPDQPGRWLARVTGDTHPFSQRERASSVLGFVWHPPHPGEHAVYLQVRSTSTVLINATATSLAQADAVDAGLNTRVLLFASLIFGVMLWAMIEQALQPHPVNVWFLVTQANALVYVLSVLGYVALLLPAGLSTAAHTITSVSVCLATMLQMGFFRAMMADNEPSAWSRRVVLAFMMLCPLQLLLIAAGYVRPAVASNVVVATFIATPLLIWMAATCRKDGWVSRRIWWLVLGIQGTLVLVSVLPLLGFTRAINVNLEATLFFGISSALLMGSVLMVRTHRARQAFHHAQLDLARMAQQLEMSQAHQREQQRFLDMLGHELRTPLMTIRLAAQALKRTVHAKDGMPEQRLDRIGVSADAMHQVLERVMEANRLGDTAMPIASQPVEWRSVVQQVQATIAQPDRLRVLDHGQGGTHLMTDPDLLRVIVSNLVDNACKYSPPDTPVVLSVEHAAHSWRMTVRNQVGSAGAPDPQQMFQKYHRAEEAKAMAGAGLGLWLVHNLVERLGGTLSAQTVDDQVEFCLCLPMPSPP